MFIMEARGCKSPLASLKTMPINKTSKGWKIVNVPGYSKTKKEAEKRLRAVKASQARRGRIK